jgi:hypothetical protein
LAYHLEVYVGVDVAVIIRSFISLSDKYWYWRLAPNHKSFLFADCGENEDVLLDDRTNKCMYLIRYKVMVSNPITTSKHVYCHLSIKHLLWHIIWKYMWGSMWPWWYGTYSWIYNYLCNQCLSPLMLWIRISIRVRCTTYVIMFVSDLWFSLGSLVSSTNDRQHDRFPAKLFSIAEVNCWFIDIHLCLGSILDVCHNKIYRSYP